MSLTPRALTANSMVAGSPPLIVPYDVAGVAQEEQMTRFGLSQQRRIDPRVRAGDKQRRGLLPLDEHFKQLLP